MKDPITCIDLFKSAVRRALIASAASLVLVAIGFAQQSSTTAPAGFNFVSIDVPCSACPGGLARRTAILGINPGGDLVGNYTDAVGKQHGFLLSNGEFSSIDVPGELVGAGGTLTTVARGISPAGEIVGQFIAPVSSVSDANSPAYCPAVGSTACIKGFLYERGKFSVVLFPGHPGAIPGRITPDGNMYGCFHDFDVMGSMFSAAWTRSADTSLASGGGELSEPNASFPDSMHGGATPDGNTMVGFYGEPANGFMTTHGYILHNGALQTWDFPNSQSTTIWDINPQQAFVGTYVDSAGKQHGFLQLRYSSAPITLDVPATAPFNAVLTIAMGINPSGAIVGQYRDNSGHTHGFLATPATI